MSANPYDPVTTTDSTTLADDDWGLSLPNIRYGSFGPSRFKSFGGFLRERARLLFIIGCILVLGTVLISSIAVATHTSSGREPSNKGKEKRWESPEMGESTATDLRDGDTAGASLRGDAEIKCRDEFSKFRAVSYWTQLVAGTNYFVKVAVGDEKYIHIRAFRALPHENKAPELVDVQQDKTKDDALEYF